MQFLNNNCAQLRTELTAGSRQCTAEIDRCIAGWQKAYATAGGTIFCHRGCSGCCTLAVNCTFPEALAVSAALSEAELPRLQQHVRHLGTLAHTAPSLPAWLQAHRAESGGCPFLTADGACSIYDVRPLSCRALLATREPVWCGADFSTLSSAEKQAFMASLDRSVVSFPMHYVAATKVYAEQLERDLLQAMTALSGFALYGNLPVLAWLEREWKLSDAIRAGQDAVRHLLSDSGLDSSFLVTFVE